MEFSFVPSIFLIYVPLPTTLDFYWIPRLTYEYLAMALVVALKLI